MDNTEPGPEGEVGDPGFPVGDIMADDESHNNVEPWFLKEFYWNYNMLLTNYTYSSHSRETLGKRADQGRVESKEARWEFKALNLRILNPPKVSDLEAPQRTLRVFESHFENHYPTLSLNSASIYVNICQQK